MRKRVRLVLLIIFAFLGASKVTGVLEGYLVLPGSPSTLIPHSCIGWVVGAGALLYMIVRGLARKAGQKFWTQGTVIAFILALWMLPVLPIWRPYQVGYWLHVKTKADLPAIKAWADSYAPKSQPDNDEWLTIPNKDVPEQIRSLGRFAHFRNSDHAVLIIHGTRFNDPCVLTVGHGVSHDPKPPPWLTDRHPETWRVDEDAYMTVCDFKMAE